jgi:formiminotetrahydrofolate cyclodeaminase
MRRRIPLALAPSLELPAAAIAKRGFAPAAGAASAWTLAFAAALLEMSVPAALRQGDEDLAAAVDRATVLRRQTLRLGDEDQRAVAALAGAPPTDDALRRASEVPRVLVLHGSELVRLAVETRALVTGPSRADLKAAAILAAAACSAAAELVAANLAAIDVAAGEETARLARDAGDKCLQG